MAFEKEQLMEIFNKDGEIEDKINDFISLHNEDVEDQLKAIKINREDIKNEKREEIAKRHAAEEQLAKLKEVNEKLEKQLADSSPDEVKKIYEQKIQDIQITNESRFTELREENERKDQIIAELEVQQKTLKCIEEFNKAIVGKNIAPDCLEDFQLYVLGENCCKFSYKPTGDGKETVLATKDGQTIKQVTEKACNTPFGKNCILYKSTGGGAEGGSRDMNTRNNPFITNNITEQMRLFQENPNEYARLKALAGK